MAEVLVGDWRQAYRMSKSAGPILGGNDQGEIEGGSDLVADQLSDVIVMSALSISLGLNHPKLNGH